MMNKKKIKILSSGIIRVKGYICGPVLTPYDEDVDTIYKMLAEGIDIVEVTDDGREVELTVSNFKDDHSSAALKKAEEEKERKEMERLAKEEAAKRKKEEKEAAEAAKREAEKADAEHIKPDDNYRFNKNNKYQKGNYNNKQESSVTITEPDNKN